MAATDEWTLPVTSSRTLSRPVGGGDVDALARLATDARVRAFVGGARSPQEAQTKARARVAAARPGDLVVEDRASNAIIGHIDLERHSDRWELSYEFVPLVWGRGLAREAISAVLQRLDQHDPLAVVVAETQVANQPSRRLLEALRFVQTDSYERKGADQLLFSRRQRSPVGGNNSSW